VSFAERASPPSLVERQIEKQHEALFSFFRSIGKDYRKLLATRIGDGTDSRGLDWIGIKVLPYTITEDTNSLSR